MKMEFILLYLDRFVIIQAATGASKLKKKGKRWIGNFHEIDKNKTVEISREKVVDDNASFFLIPHIFSFFWGGRKTHVFLHTTCKSPLVFRKTDSQYL